MGNGGGRGGGWCGGGVDWVGGAEVSVEVGQSVRHFGSTVVAEGMPFRKGSSLVVLIANRVN